MEKQCFKCQEAKDLDEFYVHKEMADGHLGKCKECTKAYVTGHRKENLERIRKYDRDRSKLLHRKKANRENSIKFRKRNPEKYHAHSLVAYAVRSGKIIKPDACQQCDKKGKVSGHHDDYYKPLEVKWLCQPCHYVEHNQ